MRTNTDQRVSAEVAGNVRAEIARARLTQAKVATGAGIPLSSFTRRLSGQTPFSVDEVDAIASFLGLPLSTLLSTEVAA